MNKINKKNKENLTSIIPKTPVIMLKAMTGVSRSIKVKLLAWGLLACASLVCFAIIPHVCLQAQIIMLLIMMTMMPIVTCIMLLPSRIVEFIFFSDKIS